MLISLALRSHLISRPNIRLSLPCLLDSSPWGLIKLLAPSPAPTYYELVPDSKGIALRTRRILASCFSPTAGSQARESSLKHLPWPKLSRDTMGDSRPISVDRNIIWAWAPVYQKLSIIPRLKNCFSADKSLMPISLSWRNRIVCQGQSQLWSLCETVAAKTLGHVTRPPPKQQEYCWVRLKVFIRKREADV